MNIVTIELTEQDAYRLMWLTQREADRGHIWDKYWENLAKHIQANITADAEMLSRNDQNETMIRPL